MLAHSHGHLLFVAVLVFTLFFIVLKIDRLSSSSYLLNKASPVGIANETLGFQKVFVINAPWRTDRKDSISLAASYSGFKLDWVDGVDPDVIQEKAYPPGNHRQISRGNQGSWRAHMNALREVVARNLSTALLFEDDIDWDFRIRSQLVAFSEATRRLPQLSSLRAQKQPPAFEEEHPNPIELAKRSSIVLSNPSQENVPTNPFGRDWDILWLGHCGADLPPASPTHPDRFMLLNDDTVPSPKHLRMRSTAPQDPIASLYPAHTRVYHRTSNSTLCTLAYAVTQRGARKILFQFGMRDFSKGYDFALSDFCGGLMQGWVMKDEEGEPVRLMCVTVQPPLFSHFWGETGSSDIMGMGIGGRPDVGSRYIKRSARGNLEGLVNGMETLDEQWADEK